jgi:hypothetical protein
MQTQCRYLAEVVEVSRYPHRCRVWSIHKPVTTLPTDSREMVWPLQARSESQGVHQEAADVDSLDELLSHGG